MSIEIERKFLVIGDAWRRNAVRSEAMRQGYLSPGDGFEASCSVRVRIQGDVAFLNIKEAVMGRERLEFDYAIPLDDADVMLNRLCRGPLVEKTRYSVDEGGAHWDVDVFHGENAGLVVAEIDGAVVGRVHPVLGAIDTVAGFPGFLLGLDAFHLGL